MSKIGLHQFSKADESVDTHWVDMYFVFVLLPVMHFLLCCKFLTCSRVVCFPELSQLHLDESDSADASIYDLKFFLNHQVLVSRGNRFSEFFIFRNNFFWSKFRSWSLGLGPWTLDCCCHCCVCFSLFSFSRKFEELIGSSPHRRPALPSTLKMNPLFRCTPHVEGSSELEVISRLLHHLLETGIGTSSGEEIDWWLHVLFKSVRSISISIFLFAFVCAKEGRHRYHTRLPSSLQLSFAPSV